MKTLHTLYAILLLIVLIAPNSRSQTTQQASNFGKPKITEGAVTIGDYRFQYSDQGKDAPTVVMDAGLCQTMAAWGKVPDALAVFTRVFSYDRAGLGRSSRILPPGAKQPPPPSELRTSRQIVQELRDLLRKANVPAPYVLVGHSFGGLNVRLFASQYPSEVAGIVLVDSSNEEEYSRYAALLAPERREGYLSLNRGANCEYIDLNASAVQLREAAPLPFVPFAVISASGNVEHPERALAHAELQADLARRAPNSAHIFARQSEHFIQNDRPDIVIEAIRRVVEQARPYPIPLPTEDDLKQTRILHPSIPSEAVLSGAALVFSGLAGWRWRKRKRRAGAEMNRAQRRQELRKGKKGRRR